MTEKRYSYFKSQLTGLYVICDGKHKETFSGIDDEYNCSRIVRKLNILTDENEQLKHDATILVQSNADYRKENEQLKKENEYLKEEIRLLKVDLDNINLFEERKVKYSEFWAEKLKKLLGDDI